MAGPPRQDETPAQSAMFRLIVQHHPNGTEEIQLGRGTTTIGRRFDNDVRLDDRTVSGYHAKIVWFHEPVFIQDLRSTNGTFVNGEQIAQRDLNHGDVIALGNCQLRFLSHSDDTVAAQPTMAAGTAAPPAEIEQVLARARHQASAETADQSAIPEGIQWVAQDAAGTWWGFEDKPLASARGWQEQGLTNFIKLGHGDPNPNWRRTLCRV